MSQAGTTIFHLGIVVLFVGVVYDQLFFFDGTIRLTEGETLSCSDRASYDQVRTGRFFQMAQLRKLGNIYFHKLHTPPYVDQGKERGVANEISVGEDFQTRRTRIIYVNHTLKYKGFEFFRNIKDGYSPLIVLRDRKGKVLNGVYAPLQSKMERIFTGAGLQGLQAVSVSPKIRVYALFSKCRRFFIPTR